jgi:Plasmid encoded RepA protein
MERLGDASTVRRIAREPVPSQKYLDAVVVIGQDPISDADRAYMARQLIQCTLPHTNPGNVPVWTRRNGNLTLSIKPGSDREGKSFGIPYGSLPRLLLYWLNTEAVKTTSRRLELGNNLSEFMRQLRLIPCSAGGGERSDAKRLRKQMQSLFRATISFEVNTEDPQRHGTSWLDMQVAPVGEMWWDPKRPDQSVLWGSWIELGERFFQAITTSPVPVDMRALRALKGSPLKLDLYSLAVYKAFTANRKGSQFIPWRGLFHQLGADYDPKRIDHFKGKVKKALRTVAKTFPGGLKYDDRNKSGLTFLPGTKLAVTPRAEPPAALNA